MVVEKNKRDWNEYAECWSQLNHAEEVLRPILENPSKAFHQATWKLIQKYCPDLKGKQVCVPSSGDNHAVFAFALLGAHVTSCDISENQLSYAEKIAGREGLSGSIDFICADTMKLEGLPNDTYDLVFTSNGVHVWLDDLPSMYRNIYRVLKPGGINILYEIHPYMRPFNDDLKLIKPYDCTGPFENENTVNFHWRLQDILNAIMDSGIHLLHIEEMFAEKDYDFPFFIKTEDLSNGKKAAKEEVDKMYDWTENPCSGLPNWICTVGEKSGMRDCHESGI